jgi:serine/threonine protein kinase
MPSFCEQYKTTKIDLNFDRLNEHRIEKILREFKLNIRVEKEAGSGSYAKVYKAKLDDEKVAVKVINVTPDHDRIRDLEKEVEYQVNAGEYVRQSDDGSIIPGVLQCFFLCNKEQDRHEKTCRGFQIIIMEYGSSFRDILTDTHYDIEMKFNLIEVMLENYETLVMDAGIYLFDTKPRNAIVIDKDDAKIIDFGYKFIFKRIGEFMEVDYATSKIGHTIKKNDIKIAFLTIIQLQFLLVSVNKLFELYENDKHELRNELRDKLLVKGTITHSLIKRFFKEKNHKIIKLFLKKDSDHKHSQNKQERMRNLFFRYLGFKHSHNENNFDELVKTLKEYIPHHQKRTKRHHRRRPRHHRRRHSRKYKKLI